MIKERIDAIEREGEVRIKALQEQAEKALGDKKQKLEQQIARDRANHKARVEKLRQAWQLPSKKPLQSDNRWRNNHEKRTAR